jgi:hypothetical protein
MSASGVLRGEIIQQLALDRLQEGLVFVLAVDIDQLFTLFAQGLQGTGRLLMKPRAPSRLMMRRNWHHRPPQFLLRASG